MRATRFTTTGDGGALAWTRGGDGPPLVKAATWLTHLDHDAHSPIWSHWLRFLESRFDFIRYDERGCGLSGTANTEPDLAGWADDLGAVIAAAEPRRPFGLLGISQGASTAITYAARHPDHVSHLILYGGYARGAFRRGDPAAEGLYRGMVEVVRHGLHNPNPAFQEVFTARFIPDGTPEERQWFNALCQKTTSPEAAAEILLARARIDVTDLLARVRCPTLVIHVEGDEVCPLAEGTLIAREVPHAEFVTLPGRNHIIQERDPGWPAFQTCVTGFLGIGADARTPGLTDREQAILDLICAAHSNKVIAYELGISEKTVRNHATRIFEKLGVRSRQEAILATRPRT